MAGDSLFSVDTNELGTTATDLRAQKPTVEQTRADVLASPLPSDAFGNLPESATAADTHAKSLKAAGDMLDQAVKDLEAMSSHLEAKKIQYEKAELEALKKFLEIRNMSKRPAPMSVPKPPVSPWIGPRPN